MIENTLENNFQKTLDMLVPLGTQCEPMAKKSIPAKVGIRPTPQDYSIISKLREKLGVDNSQIIRIALRRLAEAEGLQRAS